MEMTAGNECQGFHFTKHKTVGRDGWKLKRVERVEPPIVVCERGLHAGTALEALNNAPGPWVSWVELSGEVEQQGNKCAGSVRTRLAGPVDATATLREFACRCAERALLREREAGREPDPRSWEAVRIARAHTAGEATDKELEDAHAAAWAGTWAAWAGASAAREAAWAGAAASAAAWDVEHAWQEQELSGMLKELSGMLKELLEVER